MRRLPLLLLAAYLAVGCQSGGGRPAGQGDLDKVKIAMTETFSALEMYAGDHTLKYPDSLKDLTPKYLDKIPDDPMNGKPLGYEKTEHGYLISSVADYASAGAARGYPQMDQDGFFALKSEDFPSENDVKP